MKPCSLVLHTRGAPRLLRAVLKTVARQEARDLEVLIADDGDTRISRDIVREFQLLNPRIPTRHIRTTPANPAPLPFDRGMAVRQAFDAVDTDYVIFIGSGVLLHPGFVAAHLRYRGVARALVAPRGVVLREPLVQQLLDLRSSCRSDLGWLARHALRGDVSAPSRGVVVRAPWLRRWLTPGTGTLADGHFSLHTTDLRRLLDAQAASEPGFDEVGLGARIAALDMEAFDMSRLAITYHLEGYAFADADVPSSRAGAQPRVDARLSSRTAQVRASQA